MRQEFLWVALVALAGTVRAADWPEFRGADRQWHFDGAASPLDLVGGQKHQVEGRPPGRWQQQPDRLRRPRIPHLRRRRPRLSPQPVLLQSRRWEAVVGEDRRLRESRSAPRRQSVLRLHPRRRRQARRRLARLGRPSIATTMKATNSGGCDLGTIRHIWGFARLAGHSTMIAVIRQLRPRRTQLRDRHRSEDRQATLADRRARRRGEQERRHEATGSAPGARRWSPRSMGRTRSSSPCPAT